MLFPFVLVGFSKTKNDRRETVQPRRKFLEACLCFVFPMVSAISDHGIVVYYLQIGDVLTQSDDPVLMAATSVLVTFYPMSKSQKR